MTFEASYSPRVSSSQVNSNHRPHVLLLSITIPRSSSQLHTYRQQAENQKALHGKSELKF